MKQVVLRCVLHHSSHDDELGIREVETWLLFTSYRNAVLYESGNLIVLRNLTFPCSLCSIRLMWLSLLSLVVTGDSSWRPPQNG